VSAAASGGSEALHLQLQRSLLVRVATLVPVVVVALDAGLQARSFDMTWFVAIVLVAGVLGGVATWHPWSRLDPTVASWAAQVWQGVSATLGVALLAPFLVLAVDVDVERYAPVVAVIVVSGAYGYPSRWRVPLTSWVLVVWLVTLWWGGVRDPAVLSLHLGGGLATLLATVRLGDALSRSTEDAASERSRAEERAALLTSVLRINTLDPDDVLREIASGMVAAGFDVVAVRRVDREAGVATLLVGRSSDPEVPIPATAPLDQGPFARVLEVRRTLVLDDARDEMPPSLQHDTTRGALVVPLAGPDGSPAVVIAAGSTTGPLRPQQIDAARLLSVPAAQALIRAQEFRADQDAVEELQQLDVVTQDFVSTVSHELRTPLTVVHGLGQTLVTRWDDLPAPRRADLLSRIAANADRLAAMVRSLLDTSALERGQLEPDLGPVRLAPLVRDLLDRLVTVSAAHPVAIDLDEGLEVRADPDLLAHVVENLLTNVAKHTPQGTPVSVRTRPASPGRIRIEVADRGPGIDPDDLPHVLDRFYRGGAPTTRASGGLGLGLALAQQVVRAHGGRLTVSSTPGSGTAFSFDLAEVRADG
jgi:signal transduction histidine kinase